MIVIVAIALVPSIFCFFESTCKVVLVNIANCCNTNIFSLKKVSQMHHAHILPTPMTARTLTSLGAVCLEPARAWEWTIKGMANVSAKPAIDFARNSYRLSLQLFFSLIFEASSINYLCTSRRIIVNSYS